MTQNHNIKQILARELVPGDVMQLEEGDRISADARLVSAQSLSVYDLAGLQAVTKALRA